MPTRCGGGNYLSSKPRASKEVEVVNSFDGKAMFDERETEVIARLEKTLNDAAGNPSQAVGLEFSNVVIENEETVRSTIPDQEMNRKEHAIDGRRRQNDAGVCAAIHDGHKWLLRVVKRNFL